MEKKLILAAFAFAFAIGAAGCETVKGVGRDITGASSAIQEKMSNGRSR